MGSHWAYLSRAKKESTFLQHLWKLFLGQEREYSGEWGLGRNDNIEEEWWQLTGSWRAADERRWWVCIRVLIVEMESCTDLKGVRGRIHKPWWLDVVEEEAIRMTFSPLTWELDGDGIYLDRTAWKGVARLMWGSHKRSFISNQVSHAHTTSWESSGLSHQTCSAQPALSHHYKIWVKRLEPL